MPSPPVNQSPDSLYHFRTTRNTSRGLQTSPAPFFMQAKEQKLMLPTEMGVFFPISMRYLIELISMRYQIPANPGGHDPFYVTGTRTSIILTHLRSLRPKDRLYRHARWRQLGPNKHTGTTCFTNNCSHLRPQPTNKSIISVPRPGS